MYPDYAHVLAGALAGGPVFPERRRHRAEDAPPIDPPRPNFRSRLRDLVGGRRVVREPGFAATRRSSTITGNWANVVPTIQGYPTAR